jgi:hypothetical protein
MGLWVGRYCNQLSVTIRSWEHWYNIYIYNDIL